MQRITESRSLVLSLVSAFVLSSTAGCDLDVVAVNTTAGILAKAEPVARSYFDWESAGQASPYGIIQLEGLHLVSPDNEKLALALVKSYMAYAYGWVMDSYEIARQNGDFELAEHHRQRAYLMYARARDIALRTASNYDPNLREKMNQNPKQLAQYFKQTFDKDALPSLFWLMMAWTSASNNSPNSEDMSDMPSLLALADWIASKDPGYGDAGALVVIGGYESSLPKALGGNPVKGREYFERALKLTGRKNHILLISFALLYAANAGERELYISTLREILEAGDQGNEYRMTNKVARRRAVRALARVEEIFYQ
ncbi:MAG: hypothetical protein RL701_4603 [Pseudomonadota bacterium]|jgi:hypothetical protein